MIVVCGYLVAAEGEREQLVQLSLAAVEKARSSSDCLDFAVSPDPLDPRRVNILERWTSRDAMLRFRDEGPDEGLAALIRDAHVTELEAFGDGDEERTAN